MCMPCYMFTFEIPSAHCTRQNLLKGNKELPQKKKKQYVKLMNWPQVFAWGPAGHLSPAFSSWSGGSPRSWWWGDGPPPAACHTVGMKKMEIKHRYFPQIPIMVSLTTKLRPLTSCPFLEQLHWLCPPCEPHRTPRWTGPSHQSRWVSPAGGTTAKARKSKRSQKKKSS